MPRFVHESFIPAPADAVFAFHERPDALALLIPPFEMTQVVRPPSGLEVGTEVILRTRLFPGIWQTIVARHTDFRRGEFFEDIMVRGPFRRWRHRHVFEARAGSCLLRDEIEYEPPLGWLGRMADPLLIRPRLRRMFEHRHAVTRREVLAAAARPPASS